MKMRQRRKRPYKPSLEAINISFSRSFMDILDAHAEYQREMFRAYLRECCREIAETIAKSAVDGMIGSGVFGNIPAKGGGNGV